MTPLLDWHRKLNLLSGAMVRTYGKPLPPLLVIEWAEALLLLAKDMRREATRIKRKGEH